MTYSTLFIALIFIIDVRAAAVGDEEETVEASEGETVTLKTDWTEIKRDDIILWTFGTEGTRIARLFNNEIFTDYDEKFRDRLQLNSLTGSLIISNIRTTDTGLYKVQFSSEYTSNKHFSVTVYATLPVPNITCWSPQSWSESRRSSTGCSVVCSVKNGFRVTLSWYNRSHRLSSISDPDKSILSLPLETEHCDKNIYSCVAANPIINQTVQLNPATHCSCPGMDCPSVRCCDSVEMMVRLVLSALVGVATVAILLYHFTSRRATANTANC
ncbi:SLAM family member 5-like [Astyanax mexicanus]|uniref:SLAM family member 5-like n=1 Tax=Astyanax mexicanus TaxID=7994 RepID=A0A8T2KLI0_ASTMX|nr:SLAM family member 5-like [Astyanax mexicanus]